SLVDPDNRRPVDFGHRRALLTDLKTRLSRAGQDLRPLVAELLAHIRDGRVKAYLTYRTLHFRRAHERLFAHGSYLALEATGARRKHTGALARSLGDEVVVVVVPRLVVRLTGGVERPPVGAETWEGTRLVLPTAMAGRRYRNLYTGEVLSPTGEDGAPGL